MAESRHQWDPGSLTARSKLHVLARLIRVEHTLFSLPFAYAGALLTGYTPTLREAILIFTALLGLRSSAMAYNNIADLPIDKHNPRSRNRPLVTGAATVKEAYLIVALGTILYYLSAALLNRYALLYSPILWILAHTYPYAKRVHSYPHIHLGLVLGLAVFGGAVAVAGDEPGMTNTELLRRVPWIYIAAVTLWVAGFDTLYTILDYEFDKKHGIGSIPARHGKKRAKQAALAMHVTASTLLLLGTIQYTPTTGPATLAGVVLGSAIMIYGDLKALKDDTYIPKAFNQNLLVGLLISTGIIIDAFLCLGF